MRARRHRPEGHVDERLVVAGPPVGQRRRSVRDGVPEAMDRPRRGDGGIFERLRDHREERGVAEPVAGGIGRQAEAGARAVERGRGQADRQLLDRREPERDAGDRDAVLLGDERGRELPAVAHDHVGPPVLDDRAQAGQRRRRVHAGEVVADHHGVGAVDVHPREVGEQRHPLLRRRLAERRERQAGPRDVARVLALRRDEHVVPGAQGGMAERGERRHVPGTAAGGEKDPHRTPHRTTRGGLPRYGRPADGGTAGSIPYRRAACPTSSARSSTRS